MARKTHDETTTMVYNTEPSAKEKAVESLINKGFEAFLKDGVVYAIKQDDSSWGKIQQILREIGYNMSYGMVLKREEL